jgi:hypothetical protein
VDREHNRKAGTFARPAGYFNLAPVLLHDLLDDGQADSGARLARLFGFLGPVEFLKNLFDFLVIHADALIFNGHAHVLFVFPGGNADFRALG